MVSLRQEQTPQTPDEHRTRRERARIQYLHAVTSSPSLTSEASERPPKSASEEETQVISPKRPREYDEMAHEVAKSVKLLDKQAGQLSKQSPHVSSSKFLRLPVEVRNMIYNYTVIPRVHLVLRNPPDYQTLSRILDEPEIEQRPKSNEEAARHALRLMNRQLDKEVSNFVFQHVNLAITLEPWLTELLLMNTNVSIADWGFREIYLGWLGSHRNISFRAETDHFGLLSPLVLLLQSRPLWGTPCCWTIYLEMGEHVAVKAPCQLSLMHSLSRFVQIDNLKIRLCIVCLLEEVPPQAAMLLQISRDLGGLGSAKQANERAAKEVEDFCLEHDLDFWHTRALDPLDWVSPLFS